MRRRLFFAKTEGATPFRLSLHVGDVGHTLDHRPDRRRQKRAAGADGAAVPPLCRRPRSSPSISAARSAPRRSPWVATGMISAARCRTMRASPSRCSRSPRIDECRGTRLGGGMDRGDPCPRRRDHHAGSEGAPVVRTDLACLGAAGERTLTGLSVLLQSQRAEAARCSPIASAVPSAGCSTPKPSGWARPTCRRSRPKG